MNALLGLVYVRHRLKLKRGVILFEGNCITVPKHLNKDSNYFNFKTPAK